MIHSRASLIPDLLSAKGTTDRMVETDDWRGDLHATCLPGHDTRRHTTREPKNHPRWISEMMIEMSLAGGTT
jgi:hypothetical protein